METREINKKESFELEEDIDKNSVTISPKITLIEFEETEESKEEDVEFTGAPVDLPEEIRRQAEDSTRLLENVPYRQKEFSIDFDYSEDKFVVNLADPKEENREVFLRWLENNYPSIPRDQFIFK